MVMPLPWWYTRSWWYLTIKSDKWDFFGSIAGCFMSWCKIDCDKRPHTLRTPSLSKNAFNWRNLLRLFRVSSFWSLNLWISSAKASSWTSLMTMISASFLSSRLVASFVLGWSPLNYLTNLFSLATALTTRDQSENLVKRFTIKLTSFVLIVWTWDLRSSGSVISISPTVSSSFGKSLCHRKSGPFSQFESFSWATLSPLEAWSAGLFSELTCRHCSGHVLDFMRWIRLATNVWNLLASLFT